MLEITNEYGYKESFNYFDIIHIEELPTLNARLTLASGQSVRTLQMYEDVRRLYYEERDAYQEYNRGVE